MSKHSKKDEGVIEFTVRQFESSINDISMNNSSIRYGPILTDENSSHRNLNKLNNSHNPFTLVSTNTEHNNNVNVSVYGSDIKIKQPLRLGKTFSFLYINEYPWFVVGPQFYIPILIFLLINVINFLLIIYVYKSLHFLFKYIGLVIYLILILSHITCSIVNPGIPHRINYISDSVMQIIYNNMKLSGLTFDKYKVCKICNILVNTDDGVIHCEDCQVCIKNMSHHSFWAGKCVGKFNIISFKVFLLTSIFFLFHLIVCLLVFSLL